MTHLEPFAKSDISRLTSWVIDADFLLQWAGPSFTFPLDKAQLKRHLAAAGGKEPGLLPYRAVEEKTGQVVGHVELANINRRHGSAVLCRVLIGPPEARGRGLGREMVRQALQVAFDELGLHRVSLNVYTYNAAAIACYQSLGFQTEGTLRESTRVGDQYWSGHVMSLLEHEWRSSEGT
ncbi:GNAT family N-acetyltransferase [Candidatus Latescibacterota bacterium]